VDHEHKGSVENADDTEPPESSEPHRTLSEGRLPDKPEPPKTYIDGSNVLVKWVAPYDGGSPITNYLVEYKI